MDIEENIEDKFEVVLSVKLKVLWQRKILSIPVTVISAFMYVRLADRRLGYMQSRLKYGEHVDLECYRGKEHMELLVNVFERSVC